MTLAELAARLKGYAEGTLPGDELRAWLDALLVADPLDIESSAAEPWDAAPDETRLFWRLVYLFEHDSAEGCEDEQRRRAARIVSCLQSTECAAAVSELLPLVEDQERFGGIVRKHLDGVISRTGVLSVIAESGYPPHVKLWLSHAGPGALRGIVEALSAHDYAGVQRMLDAAPPRD
jgi:hypothetical protein